MIVIPMIGWLVQHQSYVQLPALLRFVIAAVIILPITYSIAINLYKYIEKRGIALGRKIIKPNSIKVNEAA